MINDTFELLSREITVRGEESADFLLIQPVDEHEAEYIDKENEHMKKSGRYVFAAFKVNRWNDELSPWQSPPVWGNEPFGGGAGDTLAFVRTLIPCLKEKYRLTDSAKTVIGGYSLAALFALWAAYMTDDFYGIAAASPSVWFPNWTEFISRNAPKAEKIYLSLGKKEEKTRNAVMASVGDNMRKTHAMLEGSAKTVLEWNEGGHFCDPDIRTARGFEWIMKK